MFGHRAKSLLEELKRTDFLPSYNVRVLLCCVRAAASLSRARTPLDRCRLNCARMLWGTPASSPPG